MPPVWWTACSTVNTGALPHCLHNKTQHGHLQIHNFIPFNLTSKNAHTFTSFRYELWLAIPSGISDILFMKFAPQTPPVAKETVCGTHHISLLVPVALIAWAGWERFLLTCDKDTGSHFLIDWSMNSAHILVLDRQAEVADLNYTLGPMAWLCTAMLVQCNIWPILLPSADVRWANRTTEISGTHIPVDWHTSCNRLHDQST